MTEEIELQREEIEPRSESITPKDITLPECVTVFISGPVASGKSHLMKRLVEGMERSLTFDLMAEYGGEGYEDIWANPQKLAERLKQNPHYFRIAYHPQNIEVDFHWCFVAMWQLALPRWMIIEECHEVCGSSMIQPEMKTMLRYSRHNLLGIIASSQRIAEVNKLLTSVARMIILFHTTEARDLDAIAERLGDDVADAVTNLRPCIYNDAERILEQAPECVVYLRGRGWKVVSLGDKIKQGTGEKQWDDVLQDQQQNQPVSSSPQDSGQKGNQLPEDTSSPSPRD